LRRKKFLEKAKSLALKCGDQDQQRLQSSAFTALTSERSSSTLTTGSKDPNPKNFYQKAVKFDT